MMARPWGWMVVLLLPAVAWLRFSSGGTIAGTFQATISGVLIAAWALLGAALLSRGARRQWFSWEGAYAS